MLSVGSTAWAAVSRRSSQPARLVEVMAALHSHAARAPSSTAACRGSACLRGRQTAAATTTRRRQDGASCALPTTTLRPPLASSQNCIFHGAVAQEPDERAKRSRRSAAPWSPRAGSREGCAGGALSRVILLPTRVESDYSYPPKILPPRYDPWLCAAVHVFLFKISTSDRTHARRGRCHFFSD